MHYFMYLDSLLLITYYAQQDKMYQNLQQLKEIERKDYNTSNFLFLRGVK